MTAIVATKGAAANTDLGITSVLFSLAIKQRKTLKLILKGVETGPLTFDKLLATAKDQMVAKDAQELNGFIGELADHHLVERSQYITLKADAKQVEAALASL
jgi:hypothetical protein